MSLVANKILTFWGFWCVGVHGLDQCFESKKSTIFKRKVFFVITLEEWSGSQTISSQGIGFPSRVISSWVSVVELEAELLRLDPSGNPVSNVMLQDAVHLLNTRVRNRNLSAKELLFCRDQITLQPLDVNDVDISHKQQELRNITWNSVRHWRTRAHKAWRRQIQSTGTVYHHS